MFGIESKEEKAKKNQPTGAKEKIQRAIEQQQGDTRVKSGHRGKEGDDTIPIMIAIYCFACALVMLLMMDRFSKGIPIRLPWPEVNKFLFNMPPPRLLGDPDGDLLAAMFIRGLAFFVAMGVVPMMVKALHHLTAKNRKKKPSLGLFWLSNVLLMAGGVIAYKML